MKKKRFIKLLMAMGYSRNQVAKEAALIARAGGSYEENFRSLYRILTGAEREDECLRRLVNANFGEEKMFTIKFGRLTKARVKKGQRYVDMICGLSQEAHSDPDLVIGK